MKMVRPDVQQVSLQTAAQPAKTADPFYKSREWVSLVATLIAKRGRRCEQCRREGCRIFGDHIKERKDGGAELDENNIRLLCGSCHSLKTAAERARRTAIIY